MRLAGRLGFCRLALTDVNSLAGAPAFYRLAREAGLEPIIGAELQEHGRAVVALVAEEPGYENLCRLITRIHARAERADAVDDAVAQRHAVPLVADLAELSGGLCLIALDGETAALLCSERNGRGRLWLGIDPGAESHSRTGRLFDAARRLALPLIGTGMAFFGERADYAVVRLLAAIRLGLTYDAVRAGQLPSGQAFLRDPGRLKEELAAFPDAVRHNAAVGGLCSAFTWLPRAPVFPDFPCPDNLSARDFLRRLCRDGLRRRYGSIPPEAAEYRLEKELGLIERLGFCEYFLVVWDIVEYARRHNAPVAGRGSGGSSIVAYTLGITHVCPLAFNIPFERFLHEGREDFPDLDVDFCWRIRDEVIAYVFRRWGEERVAMVCTHNGFKARLAMRETLKAFGFSSDQISGLEAGDVRCGPSEERLLALGRRLIGLPRNLSVHCGGVLIGRKPICGYTPVQRAAKGVRIAQYDKDGAEAIGLVKLDLLGNRSLSTIRYACALIEERHGQAVRIEALPPADPATLALLRQARTLGCNQLESPAMRHLLKMIQPKSIRDVMKVLALIRPGGASMGMKEVFVRRFRGLDPVPAGHPQVDGILRDTVGVMIYEDDVTMVASALMDSALPAADRFRRAIQKCHNDAERLALSREFLGRCARNGVDLEYAKAMWLQMAKYNSYSFCRAHAASYGVLAYAIAWLKTHYPLEFWCGALNNNQSMYHPRLYVEQAKREGIAFHLPDVNLSGAEFSIQGHVLWVGFNFIKGLGPGSIERILDARGTACFDGLSDFLLRTRLGFEETRALIQCGAFDRLGRNRPSLMMELYVFLNSRPRGALSGARLMEAASALSGAPSDYEPQKKYLDERRILGINVREPLMAIFRPRLAGRADIDSRALAGNVERRIRIAGVLEAQRLIRTRAGKPMLFLTFEDEHGVFEVTVLSGVYERLGGPFGRYGPYIITGRVQDQYGAVSVMADDVRIVEPMPVCHSDPETADAARHSPPCGAPLRGERDEEAKVVTLYSRRTTWTHPCLSADV